MLQVARLAPRLLGESTELVLEYLRGQMTPEGGFMDRAGETDLYYTVFGLEGLQALRADLPAAAVAEYLRTFGEGEELDFVHLSCLARCWANLPGPLRMEHPGVALLERLEACRSADGGYNAESGCETGTLYHSFLALGAYQDLGGELPDQAALIQSVTALRAADGGYANQLELPVGLTPPTAAAVTLLRQLDQPVPGEISRWLLARHRPEGGFFATPLAPIPDLLSTATALHALAGMQTDLAPIKEGCLDFIDSLWTNRGAFYGTWEEDAPDCEYTYYGLLALGHLSV